MRNQYPQLFHFSLEKLTEDRDFAHFFEDGSDKSRFKKDFYSKQNFSTEIV